MDGTEEIKVAPDAIFFKNKPGLLFIAQIYSSLVKRDFCILHRANCKTYFNVLVISHTSVILTPLHYPTGLILSVLRQVTLEKF